MLLETMNWMQTEDYLREDDRLVLVLGSTEGHAYCSLGTDTLVTWEIAKQACEHAGVVLAPALAYGSAHGLMAYPGTVSLDPRLYIDLVEQILDSFIRHGFHRILVLNGHGGNQVFERYISAMREKHPDVLIRFHAWYQLPNVVAFMEREGAKPHHASWIEGFPWINQFVPMPDEEKAPIDRSDFRSLGPTEVRQRMGDGSSGGLYYRDTETMREYFQVAVGNVVEILRSAWTV